MDHTFSPTPVSRYFRLDWNYALKASRIRALQPATSVIALMPLLQQFLPSHLVSMERLWLLWWASIFFICAIAILRARCPVFIQEYQDFSQFEARGHSHRWIIWETFHN